MIDVWMCVHTWILRLSGLLNDPGDTCLWAHLELGPWSSLTLINRVLFCLAGRRQTPDLPKQRSPSAASLALPSRPWLLLCNPPPWSCARVSALLLVPELPLGSDLSAPPSLRNCTSATVRVWPSFQIPKCCGSHEAEPQTKVQLPLHPSSSVYVLAPIPLGRAKPQWFL